MEEYFPIVQKPLRLRKLVYAWIADTLGRYKSIKGKERR